MRCKKILLDFRVYGKERAMKEFEEEDKMRDENRVWSLDVLFQSSDWVPYAGYFLPNDEEDGSWYHAVKEKGMRMRMRRMRNWNLPRKKLAGRQIFSFRFYVVYAKCIIYLSICMHLCVRVYVEGRGWGRDTRTKPTTLPVYPSSSSSSSSYSFSWKRYQPQSIRFVIFYLFSSPFPPIRVYI